MFEKLKKHYRTSHLIRTAIDSYPDGICFSTENGRPILANKTINNLCYAISAHTITNANVMWKEITESAISKKGGIYVLQLKDGTYWQFQRKELMIENERVIQYEANDITELYHYQSRLRENNREAALMQKHQKELLKNIVQNNLDKELLHAKMHIHDAFGQVLIMTENELTHKSKEIDEQEMLSAWQNVISDMENAAQSEPKTICPEKELTQVAGLIGCHVDFEGKQPASRKALLLLYAAIREALTNAVRHAGANRLTIHIQEEAISYRVRIASNGRPCDGPIQEGGGLTNLRRRLEQEGASLKYDYKPNVSLLLTIPKE